MENQNIYLNYTQKELKHCLVFITVAAPIISLLITVNYLGWVMHNVLY